ncbi:Tuberous sclerosis 2-like protein [Tilletia horrida]|nr:Tuberous sclerosis 2-like protein [Tilletia horrida]
MLLRNRSRSSTISSPSIPALDTSHASRTQPGIAIAPPSAPPTSTTTPTPTSASGQPTPGKASFGAGFTDSNFLDLVLMLPRPQKITLLQYRTHLEILNQPLPSSSNARRTATAERELCIQNLIGAVSFELKTRPSAAAFEQARAFAGANSDGISDEQGYTFVGSNNMLQLVLLLLSQEQPVPIHAAALELLAVSIRLADARCPASRVRTGTLPLPNTVSMQKSTSASSTATTTARSSSGGGGGGGFSLETIPHDEPIAGVERAAFFHLITSHDLSVAAAALGADDTVGGRERLAVVPLPTLLPQIRALRALALQGTLQLGYMPDIVPLLISWTTAIWPELQILRRKVSGIQFDIGNTSSTSSSSSANNFSPTSIRTSHSQLQQQQQAVAVKQLEVAETAFRECLSLLANLFKYHFGQIDPAHTELALIAVSTLLTGKPSSGGSGNTNPATSSSGRGTGANPGLQSNADRNTEGYVRPRGDGSGSRSKSRDARVLTDTYSLYGHENNDGSSPSPALRPVVGSDAAANAATAALSSSLISSTPLIAPMQLATLPPSGVLDSLRISASSSLDESLTSSSLDSLGPILYASDVEATAKLIDSVLIFGLLPSAAVEPVTKMICKFLGYGPSRRFFEGQRRMERDSEPIPDFEQEMDSLLGNLLRNHCANAAIRPAWAFLAKPEQNTKSTVSGSGGGAGTSGTFGFAQGASSTGTEDIAVLVGAIRFLRVALRFTADAKIELARERQGKEAPSEATDLPFMPLSLLFMALRGALLRKSDLLDLEVLNLVADLLPAKLGAASESGKFNKIRPAPYFDEPLTHSDWNSILDLTALARRHVDRLKSRGSVPGVFDSNRRAPSQDVSQSPARPSSALTALVELSQRIQIAPPPTGEDRGPQSPKADEGSGSQILPWTPKLATLLLALAPQLPDSRLVDLVQYYRVEHFCLPATADWISNISKLLRALFNRHEAASQGFPSANSAPRARKSVASLVFEHVWSVVRDVPSDRSKLMLDVIIPLAPASLSNETDPEVGSLLRKMLVDAAAVAASVPDEGETDEVMEANRKKDREVFDEIRKMFTKLARSPDSTSSMPQSDLGPGPHVSFNLPDKSDLEGDDDFKPLPPRTFAVARSLKPDNIPLSAQAAADLIGIFNKIAFGSAAAVRILTASPEQKEKWQSSQRAVWQRKLRGSCITLLRDLLALVQPTIPDDADIERKASTLPENAFLDRDGSPSVIARLVILQWILRLRTDRHHRIYLEPDLDDLIEPAATTVLRGREDPNAPVVSAAPMSAQSSAERPGRRGRMERNAAGNDAVSRSLSKRRDRSRSMPPRGSQGGPLWMLPTTLLFELPTNMSRSGVVYTFIHGDAVKEGEDGKPEPLYISEWLATVVNFFEYESNWDLLSYLICHLPHQLANKHLFNGPRAHTQVNNLRRVLCSGMVQSNLAPFVELRPDDAKKTDLYAVVYNSLTVLMSYRKLFHEDMKDEMVKAFLAGLNKSSTTAQPCIRALSIACYELQKSINRFLSGNNGLLSKLAKVMSSMTMSVHILELMAILVRLPACYANLNEDDYKLVFQICISYIQYHQSPQTSSREDFRSSPQIFSLSQYVMMLAYFDLAVWFTTLKVAERPKYVAEISRRLLIGCPTVDGVVQVTEQTETIFDFLARYTYSDLDARPSKSYLGQVVMPNGSGSDRSAREVDKTTKSKSWFIGKGLMTVTASKRTGWLNVVIRRPSGTTSLLVKTENAGVSALLEDGGIAQLLETLQKRAKDANSGVKEGEAGVDAAAEAASLSQTLISPTFAAPDPSHIALQMSTYPDLVRDTTPIPAPVDNNIDRLIRNVDFVPVVDLHKLSVLWVGPGQKTEQAILGNRQGSPAFMQFMSGLGELFTLKDRMDLPTSLDRTNGTHGKYAYMWSDHITQVFYHTATLMPNLEHDPTFTNKKALIGNDPVHIVFNESGDEYRFDTIPSQFNSINIVISPTYKGGTNLGAVLPDDDTFYRVSLQRQVGLPDFSPIGDGQLISANALPDFVRILAINSNLMAQIYNATGDTMTPYQSNWVARLRYFARFRESLLSGPRESAGKQGQSQAQVGTIHQFTQVF